MTWKRVKRVVLRPLTDSPMESVEVMTRKEKMVYWVLVGLWLATNVFFWTWWLQTEHVVTPVGMAINSILIAYNLIMPGWFFFFLGRMRKPSPNLDPPSGLRVAMVTTMVPGSEPFGVAKKTLRAMLAQKGYPHDVWLLDEGNDPVVKARCEAMGIKHFSRRGIEAYNRPAWPFKARTKEGNYNAWYDAVGYERYDVVVQMDTDHVPQQGYLVEMLRPFTSLIVAYVAAPSICNGNHKESWVVKARVEIETTLHGVLQSGYNSGLAPIMIGSHYAVRTKALKAIGGLRKTLAEDHSTTLAFVSAGYRGVFAPEAVAIGDGAASFADVMVQEYQWARALMEILLNHFPRFCRTLTPRIFIQFLFVETWYPLLGLTLLSGYALPIIALLTRTPWVSVSYPGFFFRHSLITVICLITVGWVKRCRWLQPPEAKSVTWRTIVFQLARWPWILAGCGEALMGFLLRKQFNFRVTPKGVNGPKPLPIKTLLPYVTIIVVSAGTALLRGSAGQARGYYYLALLNSTMYTGLLMEVIVMHVRENRLPQVSPARIWWRQMALIPITLVLLGVACVTRAPEAIQAITWTPTSVIATPQPTVALTPTQLPVVSLPIASLSEEGISLGVYDPNQVFLQATLVAVEEVFLPWRLDDASEFTSAVEEIRKRGRVPLVTIEPWPLGIEGLTQQTLLGDIADGRYDSSIRALAQASATQKPQVILLRWGHEMEMTGLYPWSQDNPDDYISAYQHFVNIFRQEGVTNVRWVWSPAGNSGCETYWPGAEYVDYIGVTTLASEEWDRAAGFTTTRSFATLMREKYWLAEHFSKPILAAEVGISTSDPQTKEEWLVEAVNSLSEFPWLAGWIYFNQQQPETMAAVGRPSWQLTGEQIQVLIDSWNQTRERTNN